MTKEEWKYHRQNSKKIYPLGECSKMKSGLIKVEGYIEFQAVKIHDWVRQHCHPKDHRRLIDKLEAL